MKIIYLLISITAIGLMGCNQKSNSKAISGTFTDSRDNHIYNWVKIGTQIWMTQNLAYLPKVSSSSEGSETDALYYVYGYQGSSVTEAQTLDPYQITGVLYNWSAARTACPEGWHLPTDGEWTLLVNYLGGPGVAGMKLKFATGFTIDKNSDNSSGFSAKMGGFSTCDYPGVPGSFYSLGMHSFFWTNTKIDSTRARGYCLQYDLANVDSDNYPLCNGFSIRCIKDE